LEDIQRASDTEKMKETEAKGSFGRWQARIEQGVREKGRQDRKKRQGTMGAAPKKNKKGERSVDVQAGQEATRSKVRKTKAPQRRGRKMVTKKSMRKKSASKKRDPQSRHFRGHG
jgi:hypothetical protein